MYSLCMYTCLYTVYTACLDLYMMMMMIGVQCSLASTRGEDLAESRM